VLGQIGFRVHVLEGGYQAFRRAVVAALEDAAGDASLVVVGGTTGSGKSLLLRALAERGEQVLDLEALANHRGSVLGLGARDVQPSQKAFDTAALERAAPASIRRGRYSSRARAPRSATCACRGAAGRRMRAALVSGSTCRSTRASPLLLREYAFFVRDVDAFCVRLDALACAARATRRSTPGRKRQRAAAGSSRRARPAGPHYDPIYLQSIAATSPARRPARAHRLGRRCGRPADSRRRSGDRRPRQGTLTTP
jgi:tRNA 2-selenouridine synthase